MKHVGRLIKASAVTAKAGITLWDMFADTKPKYQAPRVEKTDPMQGMAAGQELENYRYEKGAFYLGNIHPDHGQNFKAGVHDDRHIFLVAGNAAGKGRSILLQNALRWQGGFVALDPKGEIASITAMRRGRKKDALGTGTSVRRFIGQEVVILDPFGQTKGAARIYKRNYNPLLDIDIRSASAQGEIKKLAAACIVPEDGKNSHFSETAETILAGTIEAILYTQTPANRTLAFARAAILKSFDELLFLLKDCDPNELLEDGQEPTSRGRVPSDGLAFEAAGILEDLLGTDEAGSFKSTLSRNLKWLSEPQIKTHTAASDISLKKVVQSGGSVYVVIPPNRINDFKSWLRIIIQTSINAKVELGVNQTTIPTMFCLDEFPLLGTFKEIEQGAAFLRGYSCKLVCAIQNIGQLKQHYAKNWETFLGNAGAIIGFSTNDGETEKYLSDRTGKILAWETSYGVSQGISNQQMTLNPANQNDGKTVTQSRQLRAVRLPNEIHNQAARATMRAFVIPADGKPFTIERQNYDAIPTKGIFDRPEYIEKWEQQFGRKLPNAGGSQ